MLQAPAIAVNPISPTSCITSQQQDLNSSPAKRAKSQQQASQQKTQKLSPDKRAAVHHSHRHHQQQQQQQRVHQRGNGSSPAKQTGTQHADAQAEAPLSYRKRPRKASHPQCSGPSGFCHPPSPDTHTQRSSSKPSTGLSPLSSDRQLRPRQHTLGRWAAKGSRHQSSQKGSPEVPEGQANCLQKASNGSPGSNKGIRSPSNPCKKPAQVVAADGNQNATALLDNQLMVDGVLTEWTDTADKSILYACMIKAHGQPSLEVFQGLAKEIEESGCQVTLLQVQTRFEWLFNRFLAAQARRAVAAG